MRIATLVENTASREILGCEHGLSLYLETGDHRILFDMGQTALFAENAEKMGVDLKAVNLAILSHGHYDHGGGLAEFLRINRTAPVYVTRTAFDARRNASGKVTRVGFPEMDAHRLRYVDDSRELAPGIRLLTCNDRPCRWPVESYGLETEAQGLWVPDGFKHEQYLLVEEEGKRICISGCSHKGIRNIMDWLRPDVLVGGLHLMKENDSMALEQISRELGEYPAVYFTGHCTGAAQYTVLKRVLGERLQSFAAGTEWTV